MHKGYTFIEVLITLTLMILVMGFGFAAFTRFNDRQRLVETAATIQNLMTVAQTKAKVNDKPSGCATLQSYRIMLPAGAGATITVAAVCTGPAATISTTTFPLPSGIEVETGRSIDFFVLSGGNSSVVGTPIIIRDGTWRYSFSVDPGGAVSQGEFIP